MRTVNIHDAKTNLSKLIDGAVKGEAFIIAKAGKPLVTVTAIAAADGPRPRVGFMKGRIGVPDDFDVMGRGEIEGLFEGSR
ncbi:MAG: type II toxin-antitoxin system prevent-host-death family antitoxin [Phenylobacterium sp.]|uniref:type II toxin-antitoxin system Phd/YefM family antitoxin n=1 Tax=Phenylobacterium sp. TaxID=1871053 RepID=UPI001A5771CE|nr:type II toxin-antitoxin system prevent-host-death family antitoxin [Phenylobacterium sp.]MBL8555807.1 type II toxin-antitoxin system prevent-host-death family antitoxin [Phenylobacterium sp.]